MIPIQSFSRDAALFAACAFAVFATACGDDDVSVPVDAGVEVCFDAGCEIVRPAGESCDPNPCVFGTCQEEAGGAFCQCELGWTGPACAFPVEVTDFCAGDPCANGTCVNGASGFECECEFRFGGETCDTPIEVPDRCAADPCENGTCINGNAGFECDCDWGWGGATCGERVDHCDPDPCVNGTCNSTSDGFRCSCETGFGGPLCNGRLDDGVCDGVDCGNGTCVGTLRGPVCECAPGFGGEDCSLENADPCTPNPCANGFCVRGGSEFVCDCFEGFAGTTCTQQVGETNPIMVINQCEVELVTPLGWTDNGDGSFSTNTTMGLNVGGRVIEISGHSITYNTNTRSFSGFLDRVPFGVLPALAGALFGTPDEFILDASVRTGADVRLDAPGRTIPIPEEREVLALTINAEGMSLDVPFTNEVIGLDEYNLLGLYIDPCDPMVLFSVNGELLPLPARLDGLGASANQNLEMDTNLELWSGETEEGVPVTEERSMQGNVFFAGAVSLEGLKIPVEISGAALLNFDPDGNGKFLDVHVQRILQGQFPTEPIPPEVDDFAFLLNGSATPSIPIVGGLASFLSRDEITLELAQNSLLVENSDANGFGIYYRASTTNKIFEGTPLSIFEPPGGLESYGFFRDFDDFGVAYTATAQVFGPTSVTFGVTLVVREDGPEIGIQGEFNLGVIELIDADFLPVSEINLGTVPLRLNVDFATGEVCGTTGFEAADFGCSVRVCVATDGSGLEFTPQCVLPRFAPCNDDSMCASGSCSALVPEEVCSGLCAATRSTCNPSCEAVQTTCGVACDAAEGACETLCRAGEVACGAGCSIVDAACDGCETAEDACRGGCGLTHTACANVECAAAETACFAENCLPEAATCALGCAAETGVCGGACLVRDAACRIDNCALGADGCVSECANEVASCVSSCVVSAGCSALRDACEALCLPGDGGCRNRCGETFAFCEGDCRSGCDLQSSCLDSCAECNEMCTAETGLCVDGCATTCETTCEPELRACGAECAGTGATCESRCDDTRDSCYGGCGSIRTACESASCGAAGTCVSDCNGCVDACPDASECRADACSGSCDDICDGEEGLCRLECELVGACQ